MTAEMVDPVTGEVVILDKSAARVRADLIRDGLDDIWAVVTEAYAARDWLALGYSSWDDYCTGEYRGRRLALPKEDRDAVVGSLRETGMSTRAIAAATGLSKGTVGNALPGAQNWAPESEAPQPVTGIDGKSYQPTTERHLHPVPQPTPEPAAPRRRPLVEGFRDASLDLGKVVTRIENLVGDDRYPKNRNEVTRYASDLIRARDALQRVIDHMSQQKGTQ